uniref:Uncharacterized protein n=1 Tax=Parascaris univalens TaxID=6257 RepID=A0A915CI69_PARUN
MVEMEYDIDTITAASTNRAVSKKLFQQLQHLNKRPLHAVAFSEPQMLHRSPSGAQKKIRQRQEQRWLKATSSSSMEHNSPPAESDYRSLIDSGAYKSILPDEPPLTITQAPLRPPPKLSAPLSCSLTSLNSTMNSAVNASSVSNTCVLSSPYSGGKPMVEVHPMPSQQYTNAGLPLKDSPPEIPPKTKEKPRVPKKPPNLVLNSSSSRLNSPSLSALSLSTTSLNMPFTPLTSSESSPSLSRLAYSFKYACIQ